MFFSDLHLALFASSWALHSHTLWDAFSSPKPFQSSPFSCTKIVKTRIFTFSFNLKINVNWINLSVEVRIIPHCKVPPLFLVHTCTHLCMHSITAITSIPATFLHKWLHLVYQWNQIYRNNFLNNCCFLCSPNFSGGIDTHSGVHLIQKKE